MSLKFNSCGTGNSTSSSIDPEQQFIPNEVRRKYDPQRRTTDNYMIDVIFAFDEFKIRIGAHRMILLDGPYNKFFHEKLRDQKRLVVIDVPREISPGAIDGLLSYVYGVPIQELGIKNGNFEIFLNAAAYLNMDIKLLPELLGNRYRQKIESYICSNYERLSTTDAFWRDLNNETIYKLCGGLGPETVLHSFFDWIHADKSNRRQFILKLVRLAKFFGIYINTATASGNHSFYPEPEDIKIRQIIPNESRTELKIQQGSTHEPYDVVFRFEDGTELRAHQLILLDGPKYEFFHEALSGKEGTTVTLQVPPGISARSVDLLLSHIYGMPVNELGITKESLWDFIRAAAYLKMDVKVLSKLVWIFDLQDFGNYIHENFSRLSQIPDFWKMSNTTIHELCSAVDLEIIEDSFLDWIHKNKIQRKFYLGKLLDLRQPSLVKNANTQDQQRNDRTTAANYDISSLSSISPSDLDSDIEMPRNKIRRPRPVCKRPRLSSDSDGIKK